MWIDRSLEPLLRQRAAQRPVVVLTGPRQTGKTSLVRRLFGDYAFVSLDLPSEAEQAEHDPRAFLRRYPPPVIVDEVQYAPGLFRHLKAVVDADRKACGRFILTGSQGFALMKSVSDSLAGRADILALEPLSWDEVSRAHPSLTIERYLVRGGLPELYEKPELDATAFHRSYLATYLERDLRLLLQVASLRDFERFVRACALRSAQLLNRAELARDVGISGSTAGAWLSALQASGVAVLLEPWFSNRTRSLVKSPRLYFTDTGLVAFLSGLRSAEELSGSPFAGPLWETLVFAELRRRQVNAEGGWDLNFWRDRSREADFLRHRAGSFHLADAKWTEQPGAHDAAALARVAEALPARSVRSRTVFCRAAHPYPLDQATTAAPVGAMPEGWT